MMKTFCCCLPPLSPSNESTADLTRTIPIGWAAWRLLMVMVRLVCSRNGRYTHVFQEGDEACLYTERVCCVTSSLSAERPTKFFSHRSVSSFLLW